MRKAGVEVLVPENAAPESPVPESRVLVLSGVAADADLLVHELRAAEIAVAVQRVDSRDPFLQALREFHPDVILADCQLPALDGATALALAREHAPAAAFIALADAEDEEGAIACMEAGADDTVSREHPARLRWAVRNAVARRRGEAERLQLVKHMEHASQEWRRTFDAISEGVMLLDADHTVLRCNSAMAETLGKPYDQIVGRMCWEVVHSAEAPIEGCPCRTMVETGERATALVPEGDRWFRITAEPVVDASGESVGAVHVISDVTEQKRSEEALRASEERYRAVFDGATEGILVSDLATKRCRYANAAACRMLGYTQEELRALTTDAVHPGDALARIHREFEACAQGKPGTVRDVPWLRKDGAVLMTDVSTARIVIDGEPCLVGFITDITQRRRAERDYQMLFDGMIDGFALHQIICDERGTPVDYRFLAVNRAFEELTGLRAADIIGKTVLAVMPDTESYWIEAYGRVALRGETVHFENYSAALGKHYEVTAYCPAPNQFACTFTDATERRRMEERARQSSKLEAIGQLAGGVAHDFNNLLTGINGLAGMAQRHVPPESNAHRDMEQISELVDRAAGLTRQLLAFSRRQPLEFDILDLNVVVQNMTRMLGRLIGEHIDLRFEQDATLPSVRADRGQVEQILMNLVVNARDAMAGGGKLTIETRRVALDADYARDHEDVTPGDHAMIAVSDTGMGMDDVTRARIFEPFFTTKELGKGTGLGLATVYGIVKQHAGHIWVYSEPGEGTTFKIYLPGLDAEATTQARRTAKDPHIRSGDETIMLVEDDGAVIDVARRSLEAYGYTVVSAASAEQAREKFKECADAVALLVTDVIMPGSSGPELYAALRDEAPRLKVLYISGYTGEAVVHQGRVSDGAPFLQKPFQPAVLARRVRDVLDGMSRLDQGK